MNMIKPVAFSGILALALLTACSGPQQPTASESAPSTPATTASSQAASEVNESESKDAATKTATSKGEGKTTYPYKVQSCDRELTFPESPKRVVSIGFATVPTLIDLGLEDRVVGLTQEIPANTYPPEMEAKMKAMPMLDSRSGSSGGVTVSTETILAANADMTVGPEKGMDFPALAAAGVQGYSQASYCRNDNPQPASINDIHALYDEIGAIFDVPEAAAKAKTAIDKRLAAAKPEQPTANGSAAVLYVTPGETTVWTYGTSSMAHVILDTVGLTNVYADNPKRVFELNLEDLLQRNPDRIVLVNIGFDDATTKEAFTNMANMKELKAVKEDKVMVMPYAWTDPASSLVVNGIEEVSAWLQETK